MVHDLGCLSVGSPMGGCVSFSHSGLGCDKVGIKALGFQSHRTKICPVESYEIVRKRLYWSSKGYWILEKFTSFFSSSYYLIPIGIWR